jgi:hypothetical protein
MTAPVLQRPAAKPAASGGKATTPAPAYKPFKNGVQPIDDEPYDTTVTLTVGTQVLNPQYQVPSTAYLNEIEILAEGASAGNSATVVFTADGPFVAIQSLIFTDTGNNEIITAITGWDLMVINKFGGYKFNDDPRSGPVFVATAGAGGTGGTFAFVLRVPIELVPRDALGSLPNKSSSTPFKVKMTINTLAAIYSTAPTVAPTLRIRMNPVSYWQPTAQDGSGNAVQPNPPGVSTTQYWNKTDYTVNAGSFTTQLDNSVGYPVRNLIFILRDSTLSRAQGEADWPDPARLQVQATLTAQKLRTIWRDEIAKDYGYTGAVGDTVGSKDNGVYVLNFCKDFYAKPGWENRRSYLRTTDGMRLQLKGTIGGSGSHTMTVLTNYVGVAGGTTLASLTT